MKSPVGKVLASLALALLAGCGPMRSDIPLSVDPRVNAETFGQRGQWIAGEDASPEALLGFRQCLSRAYLEHYGTGGGGALSERDDGYALFWVMLLATAQSQGSPADDRIVVQAMKNERESPGFLGNADTVWARIVFERCGEGIFSDRERCRNLRLFKIAPDWCRQGPDVPD